MSQTIQSGDNYLTRNLGWFLHAVGACMGAIAISTFVYCVYSPIARHRGENERRIESCKTVLDQRTQILDEHSHLSKSIDKQKNQVSELLNRIPQEAQESEFLRQLTELATKTGFTIRDYRPGILQNQVDYYELEIRLSAHANYDSICGFLDGMGKMARLSRITKLDIAAKDQLDSQYEVHLNIKIFFTPPVNA